MTDATAARFESADIPTLRRALLADADVHEQRASGYAAANTGTELAAWTGLLLAGSHNRLAAALLGLLGDPRVPADLSERGRTLVGQVLDGWPEVLEGANDDVTPTEPQIPGQQEIPASRGFRVGDVVQITGRHDDESGPESLKLLGRTGVVAEIDDNPEYSIGLTVDGWVGLVWCNSSELRHLDAAESAVAR